jgi:hypothetical protein
MQMRPNSIGARIFFSVVLQLALSVPAQQPGSSAKVATSIKNMAAVEERLTPLRLEMTNAYSRVLQIVNQPVKALARTSHMRVSTSSPGWFHEGATKPDFSIVDVRQSQEFPYAKNQYVTSDLNPGIVFLGQKLEFNAMTKYFYTNRSLPKRKLTEAEMLEINQLYRVIGRCEGEISRLQRASAKETGRLPAGFQNEPEDPASGDLVGRIRSMPMKTRTIYGGTIIVALILLVAMLRLWKKRTG